MIAKNIAATNKTITVFMSSISVCVYSVLSIRKVLTFVNTFFLIILTRFQATCIQLFDRSIRTFLAQHAVTVHPVCRRCWHQLQPVYCKYN